MLLLHHSQLTDATVDFVELRKQNGGWLRFDMDGADAQALKRAASSSSTNVVEQLDSSSNGGKSSTFSDVEVAELKLQLTDAHISVAALQREVLALRQQAATNQHVQRHRGKK